MIIQTGMRTDIPAFYTEWFCNRIRQGRVLVRNPYYPSSVGAYSLRPEAVDIIVFCTKNPAPMLPRMDILAPYGQYWFVTITPYGRDIEPHVPEKPRVVESFLALSALLGPSCVGWRYDPVLVNEVWTVARHIDAFGALATALRGATKVCVISFIDIYKKVERNFPSAQAVSEKDMDILGREFVRIGRENGMTIRPCAEGNDLARYGADCSGCMTLTVYEEALGRKLKAPRRGKNQRNGACACQLGTDIGAYDTCGHLCHYCYANANAALVRRNMRAHDPESPFLVGGPRPGDRVREYI